MNLGHPQEEVAQKQSKGNIRDFKYEREEIDRRILWIGTNGLSGFSLAYLEDWDGWSFLLFGD